MRTSARITVAVAVLALLGALAALGVWYQSRQKAAALSGGVLTVNVTSGADRGPGTLREALFIVAAANGNADVLLHVKTITLETALPPLVNPHGVRLIAQQGGAEIDAHALPNTAVLDVAGANTSITGVLLRNCPAAAILLRATQFQLHASTTESCDVGVDVAENAHGALLEGNHFLKGRIGVRFAASTPDTMVIGNEFSGSRDAGIWAVRAEPDARRAAITVRENRFAGNRSGVVAANVGILIERNSFSNEAEAAIHLLGAGALIRGNRISDGPAMGIIVENASGSSVEGNELDRLAAYAIMVRGSADVLVHANRVTNSGYGLAFVLGDQRRPSTATDNTIIEPRFNGIDVIGDSPILRHNQVLQPHAFALHVADFQQPDGTKVHAQPFLDNNNFLRADSTAVASVDPGQRARQP